MELHPGQKALYQIWNSTISCISFEIKHYVLEPRFGADPARRNPALSKWRGPLGVRPCLYFKLTAVAEIRPLLYLGHTPVAEIRPIPKVYEKRYVLEPRFGAGPRRRNPALSKWRGPLGVRPCLYFKLTAVATSAATTALSAMHTPVGCTLRLKVDTANALYHRSNTSQSRGHSKGGVSREPPAKGQE